MRGATWERGDESGKVVNRRCQHLTLTWFVFETLATEEPIERGVEVNEKRHLKTKEQKIWPQVQDDTEHDHPEHDPEQSPETDP